VPNVQPPLPSDWTVQPTYPVHTVPYYLAPLWESGVRHRAEEAAAQLKSSREKKGVVEQKGRVPQELRQKLKKAKGAKTLLQELEEEVRRFVREWEDELKGGEETDVDSEDEAIVFVGRGSPGGEKMMDMVDSEDEAIVFVGRSGTMSDEQRKTVERGLEREKLVFDSLADDHGASFGYAFRAPFLLFLLDFSWNLANRWYRRWLVHSIAAYYGLTSRSITVGDPARREAYVGIKQMKTGRRISETQSELPRPLWGMI